MNFTSPETRMIVPPNTEDHTIVPSFVWTKHQNVIDGQICRGYYSGLHCEQCGRTVKNVSADEQFLQLLQNSFTDINKHVGKYSRCKVVPANHSLR